MTGQERQQQIEARQATVKAALDLGLQAWRITSSRRLFTEAHEALDDLVRDAARLSGLQDTLAEIRRVALDGDDGRIRDALARCDAIDEIAALALNADGEATE